jgi:hypothetical protein
MTSHLLLLRVGPTCHPVPFFFSPATAPRRRLGRQGGRPALPKPRQAAEALTFRARTLYGALPLLSSSCRAALDSGSSAGGPCPLYRSRAEELEHAILPPDRGRPLLEVGRRARAEESKRENASPPDRGGEVRESAKEVEAQGSQVDATVSGFPNPTGPRSHLRLGFFTGGGRPASLE